MDKSGHISIFVFAGKIRSLKMLGRLLFHEIWDFQKKWRQNSEFGRQFFLKNPNSKFYAFVPTTLKIML